MSTPSTHVDEDLAQTLARYVVATTFDTLPDSAIQAAKQSTLDTLGVILGASGQMASMPGVVNLMQESGGTAESTIMGFGGKLPASSAAFLNGAMAHGLDFDDHLPEGHHPSSSIVPALFAIAQRRGNVTGAEFITALAIGQDIFARLRKNVVWNQDWFMTPVIGVFAGAAACAKLLGLDERQVLDAFGAASLQSSGTMQLAYGTGGDLRGMYAGFAAQGAVFSALLAQAGVTGTTTPFEGKAGFLEVYFDGKYDRAAMLEGLGTDFQGDSILYKLWPSCGVSHGYIDATLRLLGGTGRGDEIEKIEVIGGDFARRLSEPLQLRRRPPTVVDAKFSIPYTVAVAVARGTVGVGDFSDERRNDPAVLAVADKIEFVNDPKFDWSQELPASAVRMTLKNGETLEGETSHSETPGSTEKPLEWDDLIGKFEDCATFAVRPSGKENLRTVITAIQRLETHDDVSTLIELLG